MFDNTAAWLVWWLTIAIVLGCLLSLCSCQATPTAYTGNATVQYLDTAQMKKVCPPNAHACAYVFDKDHCFIYIHENYRNNASWNYTLLTHEYLHCTGQIPPMQ